jgi:hypothetical protein
MENWESVDVSIPRFWTAVRLCRWILLFEGRVNSPLREAVSGKGLRGEGGVAGKEACTTKTINIVSQRQFFAVCCLRQCFFFVYIVYAFVVLPKNQWRRRNARFGPDHCPRFILWATWGERVHRDFWISFHFQHLFFQAQRNFWITLCNEETWLMQFD